MIHEETVTTDVWNGGVIEDSPGTKGSAQFLRSYECVKCHMVWKENQVQFYRGKPYGVPCGCNGDIASYTSG